MNQREVLQKRAETIDKIHVIEQKAATERRGLTLDEQTTVLVLKDECDRMAEYSGAEVPLFRSGTTTAQMKESLNQSLHSPIKPEPASYNQQRYIDNDGRELRMLNREERMSDVVKHDALPDGIKPSELSIGRLLRAKISGNWADAQAELRAIQTVGNDIYGGYLVPSVLSTNILDMSRAKSVVMSAGALTLPMESEKMTFARVTSDPNVTHKGETGSLTQTGLTFGAVNMSARTIGAYCKISKTLIMEASNLETLIRRVLSDIMSLKMDLMALRGSGAALEPCGIKNFPGILTRTIGSEIKFDELIEAYGDLISEDCPEQGLAAIYSPRTAKELVRLKDASGNYISNDKTPAFWANTKKLYTSQIPEDLTVNDVADCSELYYGQFNQLIVGMRNSITIDATEAASDSESNAFTDMQVWLRVWARYDVVIDKANWLLYMNGIR